MSKRYPGNFVTGNPVALSQTSNNGIWDLADSYTAVGNNAWQEPDGIYEIPRSLRFRGSAGSYLARNAGTSGNRRTFTYSFWAKATTQPSYSLYLGACTAGDNDFYIYYSNNTTFGVGSYQGAGTDYGYKFNAVLRDYSAWYHFVVAYDTTQEVALNRVKLYINGVQYSNVSPSASGYFPRNHTCLVNDSVTHGIGIRPTFGTTNLDGYMTDINFVDGQALDASYFGYFDPVTNIWMPKKYTGNYGRTGWFLNFTDNSSLNVLGKNLAGTNYAVSSTTPTGTYQASTNTTSTTGAYGETVTVTQAIPSNAVATGNPFTTIWNNDSLGSYVGNGQNYTQSALFKPLVFPLSVQLYDNGTGGWGGQTITFTDANTYSVSGGSRDGIIKLANGWYRIWSSGPFPSSGHYKQIYSYTHPTGNGSTPHYQIYGWQLNQGIGPDPQIFTTAAAQPNDFTVNNLSVTAGPTYDSMVDSPTNVFTSATDVGGVVSGNYATWNYLTNVAGITTSDANLKVSTTGQAAQPATMFVNTGKWYWEIKWTSGAAYRFGVINEFGVGQGLGETLNTWCKINNPPRLYHNSSAPGYGTDGSVGDTYMFALDVDAGKIWYGINGTWQASGFPQSGSNASQTFTPNQNMSPAVASGTGTVVYEANFGQRAFAYTPPSGFKSLNTTNLQAMGSSYVGAAAFTPTKHFDTFLWAGNATSQGRSHTGLNFQPDLLISHGRTNAYQWNVFDSLRGGNARLNSNTTAAETDSLGNGYGAITSFDPNGFTTSPGSTNNENFNMTGYSYLAWSWKQSPTAGLNIIPYTGNGAARTISHNLGVAPRFIMIKNRTTHTYNWAVYHAGLASSAYALQLNTTIAQSNSFDYWNSTAPTSSVFSLGTDNGVNQNGITYIAYVWAQIPGFSKFGTWTNNNSNDGTFVYLGFRPAWILLKNTDNVEQWYVYDSKRRVYNVAAGSDLSYISPNNTGTEGYDRSPYGGATNTIDFLSNGFKIRTTNKDAGEISYQTRN
jgi:hypothetical protein